MIVPSVFPQVVAMIPTRLDQLMDQLLPITQLLALLHWSMGGLAMVSLGWLGQELVWTLSTAGATRLIASATGFTTPEISLSRLH